MTDLRDWKISEGKQLQRYIPWVDHVRVDRLMVGGYIFRPLGEAEATKKPRRARGPWPRAIDSECVVGGS